MSLIQIYLSELMTLEKNKALRFTAINMKYYLHISNIFTLTHDFND
jgi:hypothetical protein